MSGYIGSKASVTQVDGYNRTEADAEFVQDPNGAITVSGSNVGIGTSSPTSELTIGADTPQIDLLKTSSLDVLANIRAETDSGTGGKLIFQTKRNGDSALDRMTIDDDGRVTTPYQPAFKVRTSYAAHTTLSNVSPDWTIVDHNTGNHFNVSTNAFTAPVSGRYSFSVHSLIQMPNSYAHIEIKVNGNRVAIVHSPNNNISSYIDLSLTDILDLNANDIVSVSCNTVGSSAWYAGTTYNAFIGYLIG